MEDTVSKVSVTNHVDCSYMSAWLLKLTCTLEGKAAFQHNYKLEELEMYLVRSSSLDLSKKMIS